MVTLLAENKGTFEIGLIHQASSMLKDSNKNLLVEEKNRDHMTDVNRLEVAGSFLDGESDYLFWIDDDTVPPKGAITHLLGLHREFVSGLYFLPAYPYNPIAYFRNENGTYSAYYGYPKGALVQVDSVGMGCALIHRSVYEKIKAEHEVFMRPDGSLCPMHKSQVKDHKPFIGKNRKPFISNGVMHTPISPVESRDDRSFPFYMLEFARTEDHFFCELADNVGIKPWLDTNVVCEHYKLKPFGEPEYREKGLPVMNEKLKEKENENPDSLR